VPLGELGPVAEIRARAEKGDDLARVDGAADDARVQIQFWVH